MNLVLPILLLLIGLAVGFAAAWFALRGRDGALASAQAILGERDRELAQTKESLAREQQRLDAADQKAEIAQRELADAKVQEAALRRDLEAERNLSREKLATFQQAEERMKATFKAVAADTLKDNSGEFIKRTEERLKPFQESLTKMNEQVQALEKGRAEAYGKLTQQIDTLAKSHQQLEVATSDLVKVLRQPHQRGRWGEVQLDNVLKAAGLVQGLDFVKQASVTAGETRLRPDVVVNLPDGGQLVIDAKAPVDAFLNAYEAKNEADRENFLRDHVRLLKQHLATLSGKEYQAQFTPSPEWVVMFVPVESFLTTAMVNDTNLIVDSARQRIMLASPITLIALLTTVASLWKQKRMEDKVAEIGRAGAEIHDRLVTLAENMVKVGDNIGKATKSYNAAVGSLEGSVLPSARRMKELGAPAKKELPELAHVDDAVREIQSPELRGTPKEN